MNTSTLKTKATIAVLSLVLGGIVLSFQNCSPVQFENATTGLSEKSKFDSRVPAGDDEGSVEIEIIPPGPEDSPSPTATPTPTPPGDEPPVVVLPPEQEEVAECACGKGNGRGLFINILAIELVTGENVTTLPGLGQVPINELEARVQTAIGDRAFEQVRLKFGWGSFARCADTSMKEIGIDGVSFPGKGKKTCRLPVRFSVRAHSEKNP